MDDYICDKCEGKGYEDVPDLAGNCWRYTCLKCQGDGKLNWIENIFGKKSKFWNINIENLEKGL